VFGATVSQNNGVSWIESTTAKEVADLCPIHQTISSIPEIEEVKHFANLYNGKRGYMQQIATV